MPPALSEEGPVTAASAVEDAMLKGLVESEGDREKYGGTVE